MAASKVRVAVLFDPADNLTGPPPARARGRRRAEKLDREEVLLALRKAGHDAFLHELKDEKGLLALAGLRCDLVFNLAESYGGDDAREPNVPAFLELLGLRYTGAPPAAMFLAQDKALAKKIFAFHGIRTPRFASSFRGKLEHADHLEFPCIVKPASEDGSVGIDAGSVVHGIKELMERIDLIQRKLDCPALIEEFIEGRELYVSVLGDDRPAPLPVVELDLSKLPKQMPRIAGKEVKWDKGTEAYEVTKSAVPRDLDDELRARLQETAVLAYRALGLRDYGRIDLRLDRKGRIFVIEANPNPWLGPEGELALAASAAGQGYVDLVGRIADLALARPPPGSRRDQPAP